MLPAAQILHCLVFLLGSDRVVIEAIQANPAGEAEVLTAHGWYWAVSPLKPVKVEFYAEHVNDPNSQVSSIVTKRTSTVWNAKLFLVAGEYDCRVLLVTEDSAGKRFE